MMIWLEIGESFGLSGIHFLIERLVAATVQRKVSQLNDNFDGIHPISLELCSEPEYSFCQCDQSI